MMCWYASPYREKRFVKTYADVGGIIRDALGQYVMDVKQRAFPAASHAFGADEGVLNHCTAQPEKERDHNESR